MNKFSVKREAIYNCISSTKSHPSAEWVYSHLKSEIPDLSLATVYRNINLFKQQKLVVVIATVNGQERIDANTEPHPHFICDCCGDVIDVDIALDENIPTSKVEKQYGFKINNHSVLFRGLCGVCSNQ